MLSEDPSRHVGLDLGGTNLKWVVAERAHGGWRILDRGQVPTDARAGAPAVIERMGDLADAARSAHDDIVSVGVGVPGLFRAAEGVTTFLPNVGPDWSERPVAAPLRDRLGLPVTLINDARAFGLAELRLGAGRGADTMVGLVIGSGVGGVVAIGGQIHFGHGGTGGEVGHLTLQADGPHCTCGNRGCLEAFASARAVATACGTETAEEAVRRAHQGEQRPLEGLRQVGGWLGIGIANLIVVLTPDRVVIGGGVAGAEELLFAPIRDEVRRRVHVTDLDAVEIVPAELGIWAGAVGAAIHGAEGAVRATTSVGAAES